ncbi:hypothetical protein LX36DRAFT_219242 [Colletotrichum falcatum]|nr:hypothetical protein LX36DRAFT_219242 [Colletotrichum falcatum]
MTARPTVCSCLRRGLCCAVHTSDRHQSAIGRRKLIVQRRCTEKESVADARKSGMPKTQHSLLFSRDRPSFCRRRKVQEMCVERVIGEKHRWMDGLDADGSRAQLQEQQVASTHCTMYEAVNVCLFVHQERCEGGGERDHHQLIQGKEHSWRSSCWC